MNSHKWAGKMIAVLLVLSIGVTILQSCGKKEDKLQGSIADKILRFHVLANSDDASDQQVKEQVRDAVGAYLSPYLENLSSKAETIEVVENHMDEILEVADTVLAENGKEYGSRGEIATVAFPEKTYGSYTFPPGDYDALEIHLGEGKGHNWWCVLYPNMCFRGSVYEVVEEDAKESLQELLTVEEYEDLLDGGNYKIGWKFLEYFKQIL